jgi:hypothetical protein
MGCRVAPVKKTPGLAFYDGAIMYDSVTDYCFGPIFNTMKDAEDFIEWLEKKHNLDPREPQLIEPFIDEWFKERKNDGNLER